MTILNPIKLCCFSKDIKVNFLKSWRNFSVLCCLKLFSLGSVTLKRVAPLDAIWNMFHTSHWNSFLPVFLLGSVTLTHVAPSDVIRNKFDPSHWNSFLPFFPVSQWEAWNLFQMTSDGTACFNGNWNPFDFLFWTTKVV